MNIEKFLIAGSPALEVRTKTIALAMELVTTRTIDEMVQLLKKEILRTSGGEHEDAGKYKQLLVRTLHACSIKFPDIAVTIIPVLTDFLSESNEAAANDVLVFIREAIQRFEHLRPLIIEKLLEVTSLFLLVRKINLFDFYFISHINPLIH